ncbi:MAG: DUF4886 domain-containing protein [Clostridia bacterium]|nr:DUF4886 domain-containing protein [Clostridia bacterium]
MNILSIGNSFSQDAHRYLHRIAKADGTELKTFNLYIGGCSLYRHYQNMISEQAAYDLEMNGEKTGFKVSLKEALLNREWDVVTLQQVSSQSTCYDRYQPYLNSLVALVKHCVPKAKIVIHQTWAYEEGSQKLTELMGYKKHEDMLKDVKKAYSKAAKEIGAEFVIPSGELFQKLIESGIEKVHRDTYHATLGLGRYALGLLWYKALTKNDITDNTFNDFDEEVSDNDIAIVKRCVNQVCK